MKTYTHLALAMVMILVALMACGSATEQATGEPEEAGMPNPASVYCEEQGGRLELRTDDSGTSGYCIFEDGSECEEWAYYRGECSRGDSPTEESLEPGAGLANPASVYCEEQGGELEFRTDENGTSGYCLFEDGSECEEWAYFRGECSPAAAE